MVSMHRIVRHQRCFKNTVEHVTIPQVFIALHGLVLVAGETG
jgi:hypothetical protein